MSVLTEIVTKSGLVVKPSQKLTPRQFTEAFESFAIRSEEKSGISRIATLVQAAWESGWNKSSPGWMFFGVKDTDGVNGNEQLLRTFEFSKRQDLKFPEIISVTPVVINGQKFFKYVIMDYFRRYDSPEECFVDHSNFFYKWSRYSEALKVKNDPYRFIDEIAKAGYATGPNYASSLKSIVKTIERYIS